MEEQRNARYGLLGAALSHSFSPEIHGLLGNADYGLFSVPQEALSDFMTARAFCGINVTIPYKKAVIPFLSEISPRAEEIGSVNTIVKRKDGSLAGFNTDYDGMRYAMRRAGLSIRGKKVLILGSGGTSLTAQALVRNEGALRITVVSRSKKPDYSDLSKFSDSELIINTTPVGMFPHNGEKLISLQDFPHCEGVFDVIYNPFRTALLEEAKALSIPHANGLSMLAAQAKYADDLFFGKTDESGEAAFRCPDEKIERITETLLKELSNIVLVGMPSAGKTSVGLALGQLLGRSFYDLDQLIEESAGMTIPEIFAAEEEAGFRKRESEAAHAIGKTRGAVIAAGGGTVLRAENVSSLSQNGKLVFIERALCELSTEGRPLSKDAETLKRMYHDRLPIYQACADLRALNESTAEACAREIAETLGLLHAEDCLQPGGTR